jgi:hypothetical protein
MDLKKEILDQVDLYHTKTGGKCGLTPVNLSFKIGRPYSELKTHLNELYSEKKINVRKGINHYLLFKA